MAAEQAPAEAVGPDPGRGVGTTARTRLFWTVYAVGWVLYGGGYVLFALLQGGAGWTGLEIGASFVLPAAALGVGVVHLARRWSWPPDRPWAFAARHAAGAAAFSGLWVLGTSALWGLRRMARGMSYEIGGFESALLSVHFLFGFLVYGLLAGAVYLVRTVGRLQHERERAARSEALRVGAQLEALRARLNPHFLFNSLHSLLALIRRDPSRAERAVERLGDLLRYALGAGDERREERVTVGRELEMVRTYLQLEKIRLGDRLSVEEAVSERARTVLVPPLTVQPLVENAVEHGVCESEDGGTVRLAARVVDGPDPRRLEVRVADDGPGARPGVLEEGSGNGLSLVRRRLDLLYGDAAALDVETGPGEGFEARVKVPVQEGRPRSEEGGAGS